MFIRVHQNVVPGTKSAIYDCVVCGLCFAVGQENFEAMIEYQTTGPSHVLVLTKGMFGETIIEEWLEVLGPPNVAEAQESAATRCEYITLNNVPHHQHHCAPSPEAVATAVHESRSCASVRALVADMSVSLQT